MPDLERCAACGSTSLRPHLTVTIDATASDLSPTTTAYGHALGQIVRCSTCTHMQLDPMPSAETLARRYAGTASVDYLGEEAGQRETARRTLASIERHTDGPGRLLDLGCWVGFLLDEARGRGWATSGVEPSAFASRYARETLGLDVQTSGLFDAELPRHRYDAVALGDVIEHLPDPAAALERISTLLRPGGALWLALPDAGSQVARALGRRWWSVLPTHVQYYTRRSVTTLLEHCGYAVLEIATAPQR